MLNRTRKSFIKSTGIVTLGQVAAIASAVVVGILTARYLGPEGKGQVALALGIAMILGQILCLGFDTAASYFLASGKLEGGKVVGGWIVTFVLGTVLTYGLVYPVFLWFLMDNVFSGVTKVLLLFAGIGCPLYMLRLSINSLLAGYEEFGRQARHNFMTNIAAIAGALLALVAFNRGPLGYTQIQIGLGFCAVAYGVSLLKKIIRLRPEFSLSAWLKMAGYGVKSMLSQIFRLIDLRLDIFVVNYFMETSFVGIYTVAGGLAHMFGILSSSICVVLLPRTASSDKQEADKRTMVLCRNALWLTAIPGILFLTISKWFIVVVYTERFAEAALAFALLLPGVVAQAVSRICFTDCSGRGFPEKATYSAAITATLTIIFDVSLIPRYGICGAAIASSIAYFTGGVLGLYWHMKLSGNRLSSLIFPRKADLKYYHSILTALRARINI